MIALSLKLFRCVASQQSLKLTSRNLTLKVPDFSPSPEVISSNYPAINKIVDLEKQFTEKKSNSKAIFDLLKKYQSPDSINWKEVKEKLRELKIRNRNAAILQTCLMLKDTKTGLSFYNYMNKSGLKLKPFELIFLIKLLGQNKQEISESESLIKSAYEDLKEYMRSSKLIQCYLIDQIAEIPSCFNNLVKDLKEDLRCNPKVLIKKAFEYKNASLAYKIVGESVKLNDIFENYVNYLCKMVAEGKFTPDLITTFVEVCEKNYHVIYSNNYISTIETLLQTLKNHNNEYVWTYQKCEIKESVCSHCHEKLVDKCISENDFNLLKESFLPMAGLTEKNVFLSSSSKEIQKFSKFLNNAKPYDIVLDGLNLMFSREFNKTIYLKNLIDKGLSVLLVSRSHSKLDFINTRIFREEKYREKFQYFFTDNLSDDDVFLVYAALHGGLGTYIFTNDFLNKYGARLSDHLRIIYFKWKLYHHILPALDFKMPPLPHLNLSQLTSNKNGQKLTWHLSYTTTDAGDTYLKPKFECDWICLQATKKSSS